MPLCLTWCLKFSLGTFVNLLFGFSRLCAFGIEPPKIVYWKENCQWTSHRNSMHVTRRCHNIIFEVWKFHTLPRFHLTAKCPFKPFIRLLIYCIKMHKINFQCPTFMFKGKLPKRKCSLRPLVHLQRCHFLILSSILLKTCRKRCVNDCF